jgi:hypothetical protein
MKLMADVLDQQILDRNGRKAGKVDGLALEVSVGAPPRIAYLEIGAVVLARRLSKRLAHLCRRSQPSRVPWSAVETVDVSLNLKVDATEYSIYRVENWLRKHIIEKIPGHAHQKHREKHD